MDQTLTDALNQRKSYPVIIKGPQTEEQVIIDKVSAIHAANIQSVTEAIGDADILAISVGKSALVKVAEVVSAGLLEREQRSPGRILDIILAENMRSANVFLFEKLSENLPASYPLDKQVGLVETSIGKMVPIMTSSDLEEDPLQVFAEPYNTLILDKKGFKGEIPSIKEFALKENMKAWVDRKAFIHNLGHATAAYAGFLKNPYTNYIFEALADKGILDFTRAVMKQSAEILLKAYPGEFTQDDLCKHIEDLLQRFQNKKLGDTIFRVGCDLHRKLGKDDRFMGAIRLAQEFDLPYDLILEAMSMGFLFQGKDEFGKMLPEDTEFHKKWSSNPDRLLLQVCGILKKNEMEAIQQKIFKL
jgi:mannitol-1-phosphate 5-dehydrogenase